MTGMPPIDIRPGECYTDANGKTWELTDHSQWKEWPMAETEPPYVRLIQYAEMLLALGRTKEAAEWAWRARAMIYASEGIPSANDDY